MTLAPLPPMADGGIWLLLPHKNGPDYVVHEEHIKRLLSEGARPTDDPRVPVEMEEKVPVPTATEAALQAKVDQLEALVRQLLEQKNEQVHASEINDGGSDNTSPSNDRRSKRN